MNKIFTPSTVYGEISANPSKSHMQRALIAALLARGESKLFNPSFSDDSKNVINTIVDLGARVNYFDSCISIIGGLKLVKDELFVGESGLALRMLCPVVALFDKTIRINGHNSILNRPIDMVEEVMSTQCRFFKSNNFYLPILISGPLKSGKYFIDGSKSSQFLTGLLMALPTLKEDSEIVVENLNSKPYISFTIELLKFFGIEILNKDFRIFTIKGNQQFRACEINIEGDWSGAAFFLVAASIAGKIKVQNLNLNSKQADIAIIEVLRSVGAKININESYIEIEKRYLNSFEFDATDCPDLFPPLAVLAANCNGNSIIKGVTRLYNKESNRAEVLLKEFSSLGIDITIESNNMIINGGKPYSGGLFNSHNDHRIAMAGSILSLNSKEELTIFDANCIKKSYPDFYKDFEKVRKKDSINN